MDHLFAARAQMALSLGFHIIFAAIGIAMPFLMVIAYGLWLKTKKTSYLHLTKVWSKGVAIFFAVGAVSGTALSFELGLLWPTFMKHAGPIIGMPFSWEGTAFFLEAIALGIFLYGWGKIPAWIHWGSGLVVGLSGVASGWFVICANGWMNSPAGFDWLQGQAIHIDPWAAMFNKAAFSQGLHMTIAAFLATGFAVAGVHAIGLLKNPHSPLHKSALKIALSVGAIAALLQPLSGDLSARDVANRQPIKFAAMEALFISSKPAPFLLGGIPSQKDKQVRYGIHIPKLLSILAYHDPEAKVVGLHEFPESLWPNVKVVHFAFQIMILIGSFLAVLGLASIFLLLRRQDFLWHRLFLWMLALSTPLGFLAIEAGWTVTEVGRQPWIIYGVLLTKDAVSPMPGLFYSMLLFLGIYLFLSAVVLWLLVRQFQQVHKLEPSMLSLSVASSIIPYPQTEAPLEENPLRATAPQQTSTPRQTSTSQETPTSRGIL